MSNTDLEDLRLDTLGLIRNEPVQARSAARLTALLDSAAAIIDDIGYERLTTAMVAERAGASIGTVYRYFPDRIALLQSLAGRNAERTIVPALAAIADSAHQTWADAVTAAFDLLVDALRTEPGFASLRFGDALDLGPTSTPPVTQAFADRLFDTIVDRFDLDRSAEARVAFSAAVFASEALAVRAFAIDHNGDPAFLRARAVATAALLTPYWGPSA